MRTSRTPSAGSSQKRIPFWANLTLGALLISLTACSGTPTQPEETTSPPTPVSYQVPDGCPSGEDIGQAWKSDPAWAEILDVNLVQGELATSLPDGGCGYAVGDIQTSKSSDETYQRIVVFYFRIGEDGRITSEEFMEWSRGAGGTPAEILDYDGAPTGEYDDTHLELPTSFSGWTGPYASWVDGESSWTFDENDDANPIPEYTANGSGRVEFALDADRVAAIIAASANSSPGVTPDPTTALAQGLSAAFSTAFKIAHDPDGYTAEVKITGRLQPWTSEVADSAPSKFEAISTASVGGEYTNTTEARRTAVPLIRVWALYPSESEICKVSIGFGHLPTAISSAGEHFCKIDLGSVPSAELEPDGKQTHAPQTSDLKLGGLEENGGALAQINAPVSIYAGIGGWWSSGQGCEISSDEWLVPMDGWPDVLCS